ncbi:MAG: pyridoxal phosphate enzyme (YggS family) [Pseudoalteromonas tetraodonis]|jgi:pyridoxal phosphate enzyme (YggS family)|uniref:YggS family pyridoxal phosphate-dependent enzyme n=1 Tax=Pseudoalteromonas TaxID=53246 RepID=UPI0001EF8DA9|nr:MULTISPECIES: YggS family pyridoxal phosphate-dependent enzyme [unclassified Pseudoalteromonas]PHQ90526.1 MAG: YggS family pyridoxal phosphate-dependent enzyme [Pseudoalteromonas sp.]ADT69496.1 PLP-binding domain-containing protein [Pseudoalteromonas sp. SM9913]MDN3394067.1 YggS family pyridoxal phosphate-dependent enzyme [Pseudoalteromonas sp. APC 3215]MDN3431223.1 YggS family pyridoxal phosphate-dependent enzyme [Pseudoalteromonas sp. APC 3907]MDN3435120.1 YggS family pyridoxal phosphate-
MTPQLTDKYMVTIAERLTSAYARIAEAAHKAQRNSNDITLLAVSKTKPATDIMAAYEQGQRQFGESYVQEAVDKIAQLDTFSDIVWHFIGPIQSNKSALVAANFAWVQSVDRLKIAKRLNSQRPETMPPLNVLIQVNISEEEAKSGCHPNEITELAQYIDQCAHLQLRGLMAIPAKSDDTNTQIQYFEQLQTCFDKLQTQYPHIDTLSMGMSNDVEAAIAAGSTMVRIGTDIFGTRT